MDWNIVAYIVAVVAVVSLAVFAYEYRKRLKELELSIRFDHVESKQREGTTDCQRHVDETTRMLWTHVDRLEEQVSQLQERIDMLHQRCVKNEYSCAVSPSRKK